MAKNLWKLDRRRSPETVDSAAGASTPIEGTLQTVGATLRQRREERGEDLRYVAQVLRIRHPYLKAIEDGLIDDLPGPTYAVGFVRTYAEHLDLDAEALVARFKAEVQSLNSRTDLHFPAPLPEGKIPSGGVLLVAVAMAAAVYGGWIYFSSDDQQVAEVVPQLPSQISKIIKGDQEGDPAGDQGTAPSAPAEPVAAAASPSEDRSASEAEKTAVSESEPAAAPEKAETPPNSEPDAQTAKAKPAAAPEAPEPGARQSAGADAPPPIPEPVTTSEPRPGATAESETPPEEPAASIPPPPAAQPGDQLASASPRQDAVPAAPGDSESEESESSGKIYGEDNADSRIVVEAVADSWVEVRDVETNELLLTRVLFKGDSYRVPNRTGLTLLTGNAGGLRITVDGDEAPAIGPPGSVRRNIALEPETLLAGKTANRGNNDRTGDPDEGNDTPSTPQSE